MIILSGIAISIFLIMLLLLKDKKTEPDKILTFWLVLIAFHLTLIKFQDDGIFLSYPFLLGLLLPIPVLHPVMLYVYTISFNTRKPKDKFYILLGLVPFVILLLLLSPFFTLSYAEKVVVIQNNGKDYEWYGQIQLILILLAGVFYAILGWMSFSKVQKNSVAYFSTIDFSIFIWLRFLTVGMIIIWCITAFFEEPIIYFGVVLYVISLGIYGIKKAPVFVNVAYGISHIEKETKNVRSIPKESDRLAELLEILQKEKLYTNQELTLNELSTRLGLSAAQLSQLINTHTDGNFYQLINGLRVEEFKRLIALPESKKYTINALAFDCGFKSKTTFNKYFKEHTGKTPSEFMNL